MSTLPAGRAPAAERAHPRIFARMVCLKANPGRSGELEELLLETAVKVTQQSIERGEILGYSLSRSSYPVGLDAQADIIGTYFYEGFPKDASKESTSAAWEAAGVGMTYREFQGRMASAGRTTRLDLLELRESIGETTLGDHFAIEYLKIKDYRGWLDWQAKVCRPTHAARVGKEQIKCWQAWRTVLPRGSAQPFSGIAVTAYPSWECVGRLAPVADFMRAACPDLDPAEALERNRACAELVRRETYKNVALLGRVSIRSGAA
jgi:hypothetical protein